MLQFFFAAKITHVLKKGRDTYGDEALALDDVQDFVVFLLKSIFGLRSNFASFFWNCQFVVEVFGVLDCGKCTSSNRAGLGGNEDEQLAFAFFFTCDLGVVACCLCIIAPTIRP